MSRDGREVYFETLVLGDVARISAIDGLTGVEVTVLGPANAARHDLERLARRKLERALVGAGLMSADDNGPDDRAGPASGPSGDGATRRGKLV